MKLSIEITVPDASLNFVERFITLAGATSSFRKGSGLTRVRATWTDGSSTGGEVSPVEVRTVRSLLQFVLQTMKVPANITPILVEEPKSC